jgi:hypothetical protein
VMVMVMVRFTNCIDQVLMRMGDSSHSPRLGLIRFF